MNYSERILAAGAKPYATRFYPAARRSYPNRYLSAAYNGSAAPEPTPEPEPEA